MASSNSSEDLKSGGAMDKKPPIKSNALLNRYVPQMKQLPDLKKNRLKPAGVGKVDVSGKQSKALAPVKAQSVMPSSPEQSVDEKLEILQTLYLQRQLLLGYVQEKFDFVTQIENEEATLAIIDEYLTSEKNGFEMLANEMVVEVTQDMTRVAQVSEALEILHPFVTHKQTLQQIQEMQNTLANALDVIPANIPVHLPVDYAHLKQSVDNVESNIHANNSFSFNLDIEKTKKEIQQHANIANENVEKKRDLSMKLAHVTSLKICDSYVDMKQNENMNAMTTKMEDAPLYQSTPFPPTVASQQE